jgi:hypothetical protein
MQAHVECGKELPPPTCRHFARRGECVFGEKCAYAHPEEVGRFARLAYVGLMKKIRFLIMFFVDCNIGSFLGFGGWCPSY